jgi:hypothetical protein
MNSLNIFYYALERSYQNLSRSFLKSASPMRPTTASAYSNTVAKALAGATKMVYMLMFTTPVNKFACKAPQLLSKAS